MAPSSGSLAERVRDLIDQADAGSSLDEALERLFELPPGRRRGLSLTLTDWARLHGSAATRPLCRALESDDRKVRYWVTRALRGLGPEAREAAPTLARLTTGRVQTPGIRQVALFALLRMQPLPGDLYGQVLDRLGDGSAREDQLREDLLRTAGSKGHCDLGALIAGLPPERASLAEDRLLDVLDPERYEAREREREREAQWLAHVRDSYAKGAFEDLLEDFCHAGLDVRQVDLRDPGVQDRRLLEMVEPSSWRQSPGARTAWFCSLCSAEFLTDTRDEGLRLLADHAIAMVDRGGFGC